MRIDTLNTIQTSSPGISAPIQKTESGKSLSEVSTVAAPGIDVSKIKSQNQIQQSNASNVQLQSTLNELLAESYSLNSISSKKSEPEIEEVFGPARAIGKTSTPVYSFSEDMVFTVADTDAHDVLSWRLSDHTEKAEIRIAGGRTYTAEELAKEINRSVSQQRSSRRADIKAFVEDGRVLVTTGKGGDSSEVKIEGNRAFEKFFGSSSLIQQGEGGEKSYATSDNVLNDGRVVTSGGNRVALRYWSADGEFNDFKITTTALKNQDFVSGEEILSMYNQAFEEQIGGALTARFNESGQIVFESAKGGSDSGFRLIRMGGNFSYGTNQSNLGYATGGTGGTAATLDFQTKTSPGGIRVEGQVRFRIEDLEGNSTKSVILGEENQSMFIEKSDILEAFEKAGIKKINVGVLFNENNQLELYSLNEGKSAGFSLQTESSDMDKKLERNLGFVAGIKYLGTGYEDEKPDKPGKPEEPGKPQNPGNSGNAPGKNKNLQTDDFLARRQAEIESELKSIQERLKEVSQTKGAQIPDMSWIQGSLSDTIAMMILKPETALFSQSLNILPSSRRFLEG